MLDAEKFQPLVGTQNAVRMETPRGVVERDWDEVVDVLVVGFGVAGSAAAMEASDNGADVLLVDRFSGGGATKLSGGIVYFGGGTELQVAAGYEDTTKQMFNYLKLENNRAVSDEVLWAFCETSVENFKWLCNLGVPFPPSGEVSKTSYPPSDCTLYFSGNELSPPYCDAAKPAPRGHRALGKGLTGGVIFACMKAAVERSDVRFKSRTCASRLVVDRNGDTIGVELSTLPESKLIRAVHRLLEYGVTIGGAFIKFNTEFFQELLLRFEARFGVVRYVRANGGVVLSTGGFVFNPKMLRQYAPDFAGCKMRLGTAGDVGYGIKLGQSVGGATSCMGRCCAWVFINPPSAWTWGALIGPDGTRICNEELYGSTIGNHMTEKHQGKGFLVLDADSMRAARQQLTTEHMAWHQQLVAVSNIFYNRKKAKTLGRLAQECGISEKDLIQSVESYNQGVAFGRDEMGKAPGRLQPIRKSPFYAIRCDTDTFAFFTPVITLGGLVVDGLSQRVYREDGTIVSGLYATGRTAVGIASHSYVSGLSLADGIFSGRNAGGHAARRAKTARSEAGKNRVT